jgi:hypothetical protein
MPARPLLLLDVDGVLLCGTRSVPERHPAAGWIAELGQRFELAWASSWGERANERLGAALGLSVPLPAVAFTSDDWQQTRKLPDVRRFVGSRPCVWIDDQLGPDAAAWARSRRQPTLLLRTDPRRGLERGHVEYALLFAAAVTAHGADARRAGRHRARSRSSGADPGSARA